MYIVFTPHQRTDDATERVVPRPGYPPPNRNLLTQLMEANRDSAAQALEIAERACAAEDWQRASRFAERSSRLFPTASAQAVVERIRQAKEQAEAADRVLQAAADAYRVLQVDRGASSGDVKKAFLRLSIKLHPDKNACPRAASAFAVLVESHAVLADPVRRAILDASGVPMHAWPSTQEPVRTPAPPAPPQSGGPMRKPRTPRRTERVSGAVPAEAQPVDPLQQSELGLPPGWRVLEKVRCAGGSIGTRDKYWFSPNGRRFRSKREIREYLLAG